MKEFDPHGEDPEIVEALEENIGVIQRRTAEVEKLEQLAEDCFGCAVVDGEQSIPEEVEGPHLFQD
jgi:hypothetical protein